MSKIPGPDRLTYRFLTGQPLDGHYRTDARFFHRGTKQLAKAPQARWSYLAGWQRLAVRLGALAGLPAVAWQYWHHPTRTLAGAAVGAVLVALWAAWRVRQAWRSRKAYKAYVRPLHAVLAPLLGLPPTVRARDYIAVPATFRTREDTPAVIRLPAAFVPSQGSREMVSQAILPKLKLNEDNTDVIFHFAGNPTVEFKMAPQPPDRVMWADHVERMTALPPGQIFVGLGARDKPYIRDFNAGEVVHGGFSVQTGRGKSAAMMSWIAQELGKNSDVLATVIDPKQSALPTCLVGVPGYTLRNDPDNVDAMWDAIESFEAEVIRRRRLRIDDPTLEFPLMYLYLDELSEFMDMSRERWQEIREEETELKLPKSPPIVRSLARILRMSREYGGRVLVFTQRLDNASTGGIGLRDLFGWRGLAGYKKNQWMMLIGTWPMPKSVKRVGRWIYSDGDREIWVQNVYGTPEELRDYAMASRRPVDTQDGHTAVDDASPRVLPASAQWDIVGLQAAADYVGIPLSTFRKRRQRDPIADEGHVGRSPAWTTKALDQWRKVDA